MSIIYIWLSIIYWWFTGILGCPGYVPIDEGYSSSIFGVVMEIVDCVSFEVVMRCDSFLLTPIVMVALTCPDLSPALQFLQ